MERSPTRADTLLAILTFLLMVASLYAVFIYAPTERTMGAVQRIFYFHMTAALTSFLAFLMVFIGSVGYLVTRKRDWDRLAACSAELGFVLILITLTTGPIWAKPVWGIWWTWDMRLTSSLLLGLIYLAYLMLRAYVLEKQKRANLAAVVGIVGFLDVPLVYFSIRWWRTQHPQPVIMGGQGSGLAPEMWYVVLLCAIMYLVFFAWLLRFRWRMELMREDLEYYRELVYAAGGER